MLSGRGMSAPRPMLDDDNWALALAITQRDLFPIRRTQRPTTAVTSHTCGMRRATATIRAHNTSAAPQGVASDDGPYILPLLLICCLDEPQTIGRRDCHFQRNEAPTPTWHNLSTLELEMGA